jgi:hypothetical protein
MTVSRWPDRCSGLPVAQVVAGCPAAKSRLRVEDVVLEVDRTPILSATSLQRLLVGDAIGKPVEITVWRRGPLVDVIAIPRGLNDAAQWLVVGCPRRLMCGQSAGPQRAPRRRSASRAPRCQEKP